MALIKPFPEAPWFSIDEDQYLMYLLKGYEIEYVKGFSMDSVRFTLNTNYHREDGPAVIWEDGEECYLKNGFRVKNIS